jgi:uncharacterized membrane-anchored protein YhcB (DUF1043 family)
MATIIGALIGALVVLVGARVARNATRYAAELQAGQRRKESELAELKEFGDSVAGLIAATGGYVFVLKHLAADPSNFEQWLAGLPERHKQQRIALLMQIAATRERSRSLSCGLPWDNVRERYDVLDSLASLLRDDMIAEAFAWGNEHPDTADNLITVIGERRRELLAAYPVSAPGPRRWWERARQVGEIESNTPSAG